MDISPTVMQELEAAQAQLAASTVMAGPPVTPAVDTGAGLFGASAAGSGQVEHTLVDHYFTNTNMFLWVRALNAWRHRVLVADDEQGIAQVAFAADRIDAWWNASNELTVLRCWKTF